MGCASSKSTPTVESATDDNIGKTMLENGKSVLMDVENRIDDLKAGVRDAAENLESSRLNSPETERIGNLNNECADGAEVTGNPMSLQTNNETDDCDGLNNDKPLTPMPENRSLSDVTLCNDSDNEIENERGRNCGTLNSNIFNAVCNKAAKVAMEDTDTDDCPQSRYCSDTSRANTINSRCSRNLSESDSDSDTCEERGRQLYKNLENCTARSRTSCGRSTTGNKGRTLHINGSMQLTKSNKSIKL